MRKYKTIQTSTSTEYAVICNKCGCEINTDEQECEIYIYDMIHKFEVSFGYGSKYDLQKWEFDICDDCLTEIVNQFKIPPKKMGYLLDGEGTEYLLDAE